MSYESEAAAQDDELYDKYSRLLYETLVSGKGLEGLLEAAESIFANPVLIADTSFKVLAHIEEPDIDDVLWRQIIDAGYYPSSYLNVITESKELYDHVFGDEKPIILTDSDAPNKYLSKMIKVNGKAVGFATCIEYKRQITALDERLFEVFCKVTGSELRTHMSVNQYRTHGYEFFITEMLSERVNPRYVEERLKQAGLKLKRDLHVLVASFKDEKSRREYQMEYFKMMLHEAVSDGYCVVYGNSLVVLISNDPGKTFSASSEENTREMLESCGMVGGLSHRFRGIENLHAHYEQACQAIDLGRRLGAAGSLFAYSDVYFFHMLDLIRQSGDLEEYCSPRLFDVIEYDAEYGTNYAITAHEYLKANGLPMLAAKQMDVHRNTIDYRIKRLKELFGIDFNDSEAVFSLTLSFKILRFLGKPPFDKARDA